MRGGEGRGDRKAVVPYVRLDGQDGRRRSRLRRTTAVLGGGGRRRFWRIKISPRLGFFRAASPRGLLARIRDAYVRLAERIAGSTAFGYGGGAGGAFGRPEAKEYEEEEIIRYYRSLPPRGGGAVGLYQVSVPFGIGL